MTRTISNKNGKEIKITAAGYLYINGVKQDNRIVTPLYTPTVAHTDNDIWDICKKYTIKNYRMC